MVERSETGRRERRRRGTGLEEEKGEQEEQELQFMLKVETYNGIELQKKKRNHLICIRKKVLSN